MKAAMCDLAAGDMRVNPTRHPPAPDGVDHHAMQLIFARAWRRDAALLARSKQVQLPRGDLHDITQSMPAPLTPP
jgi:hypothetical protein